jgi:hypothetical protein
MNYEIFAGIKDKKYKCKVSSHGIHVFDNEEEALDYAREIAYNLLSHKLNSKYNSLAKSKKIYDEDIDDVIEDIYDMKLDLETEYYVVRV